MTKKKKEEVLESEQDMDEEIMREAQGDKLPEESLEAIIEEVGELDIPEDEMDAEAEPDYSMTEEEQIADVQAQAKEMVKRMKEAKLEPTPIVESELEKVALEVVRQAKELPEAKPKKKHKKTTKKKTKTKPKKKSPESPIEDTLIAKENDVITRMKEQDAILKKIAEFPTEITGEVKTEQEIPIAEEARHYLHLLEYAGQETDPETNKPLSEFRLIISPFDEIITARWIKQRDVVTKMGFDIAPCDYWDTIYKTSIYYDPVGKEVAVYQLIYNSAMSEIGMFAPKVEKELKDKEIVALLNKHIIAEHLRLSAENLTLRKRVKWWEEYTKALIGAKDETGGKLYAHMMKMASQLSETDRWKVGKEMGWADKINHFFVKHPDFKMLVMVGGLVLLAIWAMFATGILKVR